MSISLYEHQKKAVEKLKDGSVLCGGVGTGKSRTALAYFHTKVCGGALPKHYQLYDFGDSRKPLYIITTARKRDTGEWDKECAQFLFEPGVDYVVDSWNNIRKYADVEDSFFIFDEQRLVGYGSWTKTFLKIAKSNRWILLSATPGDTWMDYCAIFIANGFYKNKTDFVNTHVVYDRFLKFPKIKRYLNTALLEKHRQDIVITMVYDKKATQHHEWIKVGYDENLYGLAEKNRWDIYKDEPITNISSLCYILRRIVNEDRRRVTALHHVFERHPKIVVFYNFNYERDLLRSYARSTGTLYSEWNGEKHEAIPKGDRWLYLVQYTAGAEGWNCTETDTVAFFSQNYSYKTTVQACGRIDRLNTPFADLYYYHMFSDSPIDKSIRNCLKHKKNFNEKIFSESLTPSA